MAVVDSADGSITDVHKELMSGADTVAALAGMVAGLDALETRPQSVFIVGSGVDIAALKPQLEAVTSLPVTAAEEPETALAWGAALASANAPLFASSTAALAYAQDPGTGAIDPYAVAPGYLAAPDVPFGTELGEEDLAYSAVPDEEAEANTAVLDEPADEHLDGSSERRPLVLVGSVLAVVVVAAALSLEVSLALGIRPSVALLPRPLQNLIVPTQQAPAPAPPRQAPRHRRPIAYLRRWWGLRPHTQRFRLHRLRLRYPRRFRPRAGSAAPPAPVAAPAPVVALGTGAGSAAAADSRPSADASHTSRRCTRRPRRRCTCPVAAAAGQRSGAAVASSSAGPSTAGAPAGAATPGALPGTAGPGSGRSAPASGATPSARASGAHAGSGDASSRSPGGSGIAGPDGTGDSGYAGSRSATGHAGTCRSAGQPARPGSRCSSCARPVVLFAWRRHRR